MQMQHQNFSCIVLHVQYSISCYFAVFFILGGIVCIFVMCWLFMGVSIEQLLCAYLIVSFLFMQEPS